ncbi:rho family-interacting cell polarization regulator 2-like isoform X1 [Amphibalanus amphitrite]|uniref:rho family-interacting cell polarization regulator 2-like isoform X1 n=1 Tax=Amphibalanus amphitrite TaxID=1232801 RepID=UPI001C91E30A|nr:rho family-interacting cell polarization regulator 2-like isoform X1 [Amphibalanus amphitrite]
MASSPPPSSGGTGTDPASCAVSRSRSFCTAAAPGRRVVSATLSSDGSFESDVSRYSWQCSDVLGQSVRSPRESRRWIGLPGDCRVPKQPSYRRALAMTDALMTGVREAIELERHEVQLLRDSLDSVSLHSAQSQGRLYETERRLRFTERYVKRLECHLVEIEQLAEQYGKQQRLREATERLAAAYSSSSGTQSQRGLSQARSGFKECTDEMCLMEAQLESKMGTLLFELKGIQGFARLCAGDVYEICVRLGSQEWRCRGTIGKDQQQRWNRPRRILRPTLADQLVIKASEVKTLGKHVLGTKVCEIGELLSAHTQQMVIYLNTTGSLKLTLIVTWSAIETFPEDTLSRQVSASSPGLRRRTTINSPRLGLEARAANMKLSSGGSSDSALVSGGSGSGLGSPDSVSVTSSDSQVNLADSTPDILRRTPGQTSSQQWQRDSCSSAGSADGSAEPDDDSGTAYTLEKRPEMKRDWYATAERKNRARKQQQQQQQAATEQPSDPAPLPVGSAQLWRGSGRLRAVCAAVAARLSASDRSPAEARLGAVAARLAARPSGLGRRWSHDSDVSVESALDKFSFLQGEQEEGECKPDLLEPGMTARTSDSGISSIVHQLSEEPEREAASGDGTADSSLGLSETGSLTDLARSALDLCTELHLTYCLRLLEGVSSCGPLRLRSASSLRRLERQVNLLELMMTGPPLEEILNDTQILTLWQDLCEGAPLYHVTAGAACERLSALLQPRLEYRDVSMASKVSRLVVCRCLDLPEFAPDQQLTVFALRDFTDGTTLDRVVEDLSEEVQLTDTLQSHSAESISRRLSQLVYMPPPAACLRVVCQLLSSAGPRVTETVCGWLREVSRTDCITGQLIPSLLELLESDEPGEREGSVRALLLLAGPARLLEPLQYLVSADPDGRVCAAAELGLTDMGADGRAALQQARLARAGRSEEPAP